MRLAALEREREHVCVTVFILGYMYLYSLFDYVSSTVSSLSMHIPINHLFTFLSFISASSAYQLSVMYLSTYLPSISITSLYLLTIYLYIIYPPINHLSSVSLICLSISYLLSVSCPLLYLY